MSTSASPPLDEGTPSPERARRRPVFFLRARQSTQAPLGEQASEPSLPLPRERSLHIAHFAHSLWADSASAQMVELLRGLPRHHRLHVAVLENEGPLRGAVARLGLEPREFRQAGTAQARGASPQRESIESWLRTTRVDLVHVHDMPSALVTVPAALRAGCPVVLNRGALASGQDRTRRAALRWLTRRVWHVVVDEESTQRQLFDDEGLPAEHISVIRPGFDLDRFDTAVRAGLHRPLPTPPGAPAIVHVGPMEDPSGREEDLLCALVSIRHRFPLLRALFVGDGPRRAELELHARRLGLSAVAHFLGHREDVPAVLARAWVGVSCSAEPVPCSALLGSMACGLPMVATAVGGTPELLAHGGRGWLVPPGSPEALAEALASALEDPERSTLLGSRARTFVARELGIARWVAEHDALYRRLTTS